MRKHLTIAMVALAALAIHTACGDTIIGGDTITNNNGPGTTVSPSPGTTGSCPVAGVIDSIRVNPFGVRCAPGIPTPRNGDGVLPVGCTADVTATPKDSRGDDVPAAVHGQGIAWAATFGASCIDVADGVQPFNKVVSPRAGVTACEFQVSATLCSKTGSWNGRVVP